ncbi:hypothetical protein Syun_026537 [Stephania yunnanensis]|uniref:GrpE protein homolog n=1 Tax=Stephania yunnanensis TaxID=152371 RepID=A0AAP0HVU9_9MAGN
MATILRTPSFLHPPRTSTTQSPHTHKSFLSFTSHKRGFSAKSHQTSLTHLFISTKSTRPSKLRPFAAYEESTETEEAEAAQTQKGSDDELPIEDSNDGVVVDSEEKLPSVIVASLQSYKEALLKNDESKVAEIEAFLQSLEEEKKSLANEVASLSQELSSVRERFLRINADFDNYRKRTEREQLSVATNAQGEVVESLLPVLDNFERAKAQIKVENEVEEKINNSYQSIYKQFVEILESIGVVPVETIGNPFDPLLHEAIMREESTEFEEGIILEQYRKGFKLGDRLLRPSMVKVSAGPGPAKPEVSETSEEAEKDGETSKEDGAEVEAT